MEKGSAKRARTGQWSGEGGYSGGGWRGPAANKDAPAGGAGAWTPQLDRPRPSQAPAQNGWGGSALNGRSGGDNGAAGGSWRDRHSDKVNTPSLVGGGGGGGYGGNGGKGNAYDSGNNGGRAFGQSALGGSWRDSKGSSKGGFEDSSRGGGKGGFDDYSRGVSKGGYDNDYSRGGPKGGYDDYSRGAPKGGKNRDDDYNRGDPWGGGGGGGFASDKGSGGKKGAKGGRDERDEGGKSGGKGGKEGKGGKDRNEGGGKAGKNGKGGESKKSGGDQAVREPPPEKEPENKKRSGGSGAVTAAHLSDKKFSELPISPESKRALAEGFGYELMTMVQAATIGPMLAKQDVLARARTGTGKTLAFLVPIIELIRGRPGGVGGAVGAIVLSPTRELASQISEEAKLLLKYHPQLGSACFFGGTNIKGDHGELARRPIDILVATPGRLQDHLDNTKGFKPRLENLAMVCLDEADQLLDMGFRDAILKILKAMPPPAKRQGALFSATFPAQVEQIAKLALKSNNEVIDTVRPDEEVTPDQIDQSVCVTDMEGMTEYLWAAVNFEMKRCPKTYKIMVFFTTARLTGFFSEQFSKAKCEVLEIHSRKSQAHRTKCTDTFRKASCGVIFSSDVSARGLDYPDVTAVIQVGIPSNRDQYIHRLGRTGRAGKSGRCILLLHDFEQFFLRSSVKDLPIKRIDMSAFPGVPAAPDSLWVPACPKSAGQAYQAMLGYYNSVKGLGWNKEQLVAEATRFAAAIGAVGHDGLPPPILKKTVGMMGLRGVPGLNIVSQLPYGD